jgi:hypothetical protein
MEPEDGVISLFAIDKFLHFRVIFDSRLKYKLVVSRSSAATIFLAFTMLEEWENIRYSFITLEHVMP